MEKLSDKEKQQELRNRIMGFGESSMRKSYYADLLKRNEQLERYRTLLDTVEQALALLSDDNLCFVDMNEGTCRLFEMREEELKHSCFCNLVTISSKDLENLKEGNSLWGEFTFLSKESGERIIHYTLNKGSFDKSKYYILIAKDITEARAQEKAKQQAEKLTAIGQLAGGVAHDFNNQLVGIVGFAELLLSELSPDSPLQEYIDNILHCANVASDLTHSLLTFARRRPEKQGNCDVHKSITHVVGILERTVGKGIQISTEFIATEYHVSIDQSLLENALLNLGINARDAMPEGGELRYATKNVWIDESAVKQHVGLEKSGIYLAISISDTGTGIPPELEHKIFEPFFTSKEEGKGTGLGLSTVYGTVLEASGSIDVVSKVGEGTTFTIYLPPLSSEDKKEGK